MEGNFQNIRYDMGPKCKGIKEDKGKGVRCFECEGFCHIKVEFPTFIKNLKRGLFLIWSKSDDESEDEIANKVMAFTRKYDFCSEASDEDMSVEELAEIYRELLTKWKESYMREEKQKKTISSLLMEKEKLGIKSLQVWRRKSHC